MYNSRFGKQNMEGFRWMRRFVESFFFFPCKIVCGLWMKMCDVN
jgi:hypothetical protein